MMRLRPFISMLTCVVFFGCLGLAYAVVDHSVYKSKAECLVCHPRALPSHRMGKPVRMTESWPLDADGSLVCATCHECVSGTCALRKRSPELCSVCHDCTQGMSCLIGVAHLGSRPDLNAMAPNCFSAHDGTIGKPVMGPGEHKMDILYIKKKDFKSVRDKRIVFIDGRLTCISCHNPYRTTSAKLVRSNSNSALCLTCHIK